MAIDQVNLQFEATIVAKVANTAKFAARNRTIARLGIEVSRISQISHCNSRSCRAAHRGETA